MTSNAPCASPLNAVSNHIGIAVAAVLGVSDTQTICFGNSYAGYDSTGTYADLFTAAGGCDSVRVLHLTVLPLLEDTVTQTIAQGQAYAGHTSSGIFVDTLTSSLGCDSIRTLFLTVTVNPDTMVWPGDADNDGIANNFDILSLGIAYNDTGSLRPNATNIWVAQPCPVWQNTFITGVNFNHADCDGNGLVDANDTLPILLNYGLTHAKDEAPRGGGVPLYLQITNAPVEAGDTAEFDIILGDTITPAINIYGIAFSIEYDNSLIVPGSFQSHFTDSWMGQLNGELITLTKPFPDRIDMGLSRINHNNVSGIGVIGHASVITIDNISGKDTLFSEMILRITGEKAIDNEGTIIPVDGKNDTLVTYRVTDHIAGPDQSDLIVFPNPSSGNITIRSSQIIDAYRIINPQGVIMMQGNDINNKEVTFRPGLNTGIYLLETICGGQRVMKRIVLLDQ
jgi:hypothetical protein